MIYKKIALPLTYKNIQENGSIKGYASVFHHIDHQNDTVLPGAFSKTIASWHQKKEWPKMLWQHDPMHPIGYWTGLKEDHYGLQVQGQLMLDIQKAKETYLLLKSGAINGLSIGFRVEKSAYPDNSSIRALHEIDLHEISFVTFAANAQAKITEVKAQPYPSFNDQNIEHKADIQNMLQEIESANLRNFSYYMRAFEKNLPQ